MGSLPSTTSSESETHTPSNEPRSPSAGVKTQEEDPVKSPQPSAKLHQAITAVVGGILGIGKLGQMVLLHTAVSTTDQMNSVICGDLHAVRGPAQWQDAMPLAKQIMKLLQGEPMEALLQHHENLAKKLETAIKASEILQEDLKQEQVTRMEVTAALEDLNADLRAQNSSMRAQILQHECDMWQEPATVRCRRGHVLHYVCCAHENVECTRCSQYLAEEPMINSDGKRKRLRAVDASEYVRESKRRRV